MTHERNSGFYFVKRAESWEPGFYMMTDKIWFLSGLMTQFKDADFLEIKDERINLPD